MESKAQKMERELFEREAAEKRRGQRADKRRAEGGRVVTAAKSSNRRQRRAYEKLMRNDKDGKLRAKIAEEIEKRTAAVKQRIADGESIEDIRADLKRQP